MVALVGRILLSSIFLLSAVGKIFQYSDQVAHAESAGLPLPQIAIILAAIWEIVAGLALLAGYQAKVAAWLLFLYLIPATLVFHTNFSDQNQMIHFLKNVAIMGGLLQVAHFGSHGRTP